MKDKLRIALYNIVSQSSRLMAFHQWQKQRKCLKFEQKISRQASKIRHRYGPCVFMLATPCHGNLGDHAIVSAQYNILKKAGVADNIVEISNKDYSNYHEMIKNYVQKNDIIVIDGGGNLGTLWPNEDDKITEIIQTYHENKIVIFPQTCYYDETLDAQKRLLRNQTVYKNAENLTIMLRDRRSYDFCVEHFSSVKLLYVPDIVLSLQESGIEKREPKCLVCFRNDLETAVSTEGKKELATYLDEMNIATQEFSTIYPQNISANQREERLSEIWNTLKESKLLLTDRLHGMIFAAITGTPCLALDNKSKKVSGVYAWISQLHYITVCDTVSEMLKLVPSFYQLGGQVYPTDLLEQEFDKVVEIFVNEQYHTEDNNYES